MQQVSFILPRDNNVEGRLPAGTYRVTLSGFATSGAEVLTVEGWNGSAWTSLGTKSKANSGRLGFLQITVPASGRVRCSIPNTVRQPASCKVRISR